MTITTTRFSKAKGTFYPLDIEYKPEDLPADLIEVSLADYHAAMDRPAGYTFDFVNGALVVSAPLPPTLEQLWATYQGDASALLTKSDLVALRCFKAGVPFPADWKTYADNLRVIVGAATGDPTKPLPARPAYPAGT